jgi:hypothetical protein
MSVTKCCKHLALAVNQVRVVLRRGLAHSLELELWRNVVHGNVFEVSAVKTDGVLQVKRDEAVEGEKLSNDTQGLVIRLFALTPLYQFTTLLNLRPIIFHLTPFGWFISMCSDTSAKE